MPYLEIKMKLLSSVALFISLFTASVTNAALMASFDGQTVYDSDLNITWLANANLAATNTFGVSGINTNGSMSWGTAQSWISAMNASKYLGYHDWRLPSTLQPDASCQSQDYGSFGILCTGSDMGHLFYSELGGVATQKISTVHNANYDLFKNFKSDRYWSTEE